MNIVCDGMIFGIEGARILEDTSNGDASVEIYGVKNGGSFRLTLNKQNRDDRLESIYRSIRNKVIALVDSNPNYFDITMELNALNGIGKRGVLYNSLFGSKSPSFIGQDNNSSEAHNTLGERKLKGVISGNIGAVSSSYIGVLRPNLSTRDIKVYDAGQHVMIRFLLDMRGGNKNTVTVDLTLAKQSFASESGGQGDEYVRQFLKVVNTQIEQVIGSKQPYTDLKRLIESSGRHVGCRVEVLQSY